MWDPIEISLKRSFEKWLLFHYRTDNPSWLVHPQVCPRKMVKWINKIKMNTFYFFIFFCTQVMLFNPVCIVAYTYVSWNFFRQRIYEEEISLLNFFGEEYLDYQKEVKTGLPFIKGYRMVLWYRNRGWTNSHLWRDSRFPCTRILMRISTHRKANLDVREIALTESRNSLQRKCHVHAGHVSGWFPRSI